jgi:hypothetical protein
MSPHPNVDARLERVKVLWVEISTTPPKSKRYEELVDKIRTESVAYLAGVDAAIGADRRCKEADRRQLGVDPTERRVERRQHERRR